MGRSARHGPSPLRLHQNPSAPHCGRHPTHSWDMTPTHEVQPPPNHLAPPQQVATPTCAHSAAVNKTGRDPAADLASRFAPPGSMSPLVPSSSRPEHNRGGPQESRPTSASKSHGGEGDKGRHWHVPCSRPATNTHGSSASARISKPSHGRASQLPVPVSPLAGIVVHGA